MPEKYLAKEHSAHPAAEKVPDWPSTASQIPGRLIPDSRAVLSNCAVLRHWSTNLSTIEPQQFDAMATNLLPCHDGAKVVAELLERRPDFKSRAIALEEARRKGDVTRCSEFRFRLGGEALCGKCPEWHFCRTPLQLGLPHGMSPERSQLVLRGDNHEMTNALEEGLKRAVENGLLVFQRNRQIVRVVLVKGIPTIEPLNPVSLVTELQSRYEIVAEDEEGDAKVLPGVPEGLAKQFLVRRRWRVPGLKGISGCPIFTESGALATIEGYNPSTELFVSLCGSGIPDVPPIPTEANVAAALRFIREEFLVDFKLKDRASEANVIGLGVLPYVRDLIEGPVPLHLLSAHCPGCGKTKLVQLLGSIATGRTGTYLITPTDRDWDWRMRITSTLLEEPTMICIDNIKKKLDSASMASALTNTDWKDRLNKSSKNVSLANRAIWCATGNNAKLSSELARRTVLIMFNPTLEKPWLRTGFKHPMIDQWVRENRGKLLQSFLVLCRNWFVKGRPGCSKTMGSYEEYVQVVGGILEANGIPGFLENQKDLLGTVDAEEAELSDFVSSWAATFGTEPVSNEHLVEHAVSHDLMKTLLSGGTMTAKKNRLGRRLRDLESTVVVGYVIRTHLNAANKTYTYSLAPEEPPATENNPAERPASPKPAVRRKR